MAMNPIFNDTRFKVVLGILSILPLLVGLYLFYMMIPAYLSSMAAGLPTEFRSPFAGMSPDGILLLTFGVTFLMFVPMLILLKHLYDTNRIEEGKKTFLAILLIFFHVLSMPVYFYTFIWKNPKK